MGLETMTDGLRDRMRRAGDVWLQQGRVVGARALRTGAWALSRVAERLDEMAERFTPMLTREEATGDEARKATGHTEEGAVAQASADGSATNESLSQGEAEAKASADLSTEPARVADAATISAASQGP